MAKIFGINFVLCHRRPKRCITIKGWRMPLCARCSGILAGMLLAFGYKIFFGIHFSQNLMITGILLILPTAIDGFTQLYGYRKSTNFMRLTTGFLAGIGLIIFTKFLNIWLKLLIS